MVGVLDELFAPAMETLPNDISDVTIEARESNEAIPETSSAALEAQKVLDDAIEGLEDAAPVLRAGNLSVSFTDNDFIYTVNFNNRDYRVLFPENMREYLVVRDGYLINTYGSSVTGVILANGDSAAIDSYHSQYLTLYPFTNTSGNSAAYNYGAYSYITSYSPNSYGTGLTSQTTYGNARVTAEPGLFRGFTDFQLIMIFAAGLLVLIQFFGGIFRR